MIYKILDQLPTEAQAGSNPEAVLPTTPLDAKDGYIHLSIKSEVVPTLDKFFKDVPAVYVLHVDVPEDRDAEIKEGNTGNRSNSQLKWEWVESRNAWFPHIYGVLQNKDIVKVDRLVAVDGKWVF